jgi:predicted HicB family RNase H-like nuclease
VVEAPSVMTPERMRGVPNTPGTPRRTIRVDDELWLSAVVKAAERGESVSDVIRRALERYVTRK